MMYISAIPWIFNIVLVGTIILLAGEIIVARKDEREAYKQMLNSLGKNEQSEENAKETSEDLNDMADGEMTQDKVYLVNYYMDYETHGIYAIFKSKEDAEACAKMMTEYDADIGCHYGVHEEVIYNSLDE